MFQFGSYLMHEPWHFRVSSENLSELCGGGVRAITLESERAGFEFLLSGVAVWPGEGCLTSLSLWVPYCETGNENYSGGP